MKETGFIEIKQSRIYYEQEIISDSADDPTLVFLHDALGSVKQWKDVPSQIADRLKMNALVYDRVGSGESDPFVSSRPLNYLELEATEMLPVLLDTLKIKNPWIIGHSDGGSIGLIFASRFHASGLICEAAHIYVEDQTIEGVKATKDNKDKITKGLMPYHKEKTESLFEAWTGTWLSDSYRKWDISEKLKNISCPVLILQGDSDEYATEEQAMAIRTKVGGRSELNFITDCGHIPHQEKKEEVIHCITSFIQRHTQ